MSPPVRLCYVMVCAAVLLSPGIACASFSGPAELVPMQAALPEPWGLLKLLLLITFALHLLLVNIVIGSCLIALAGSFQREKLPAFSMKHETSFITKALALAVNMGVAPYLFMQVLYGSFFYPSTLLMAAWWMAIIGFVMLAYYGLYIVSDKSAAGLTLAKPILAAITLLLLATAFMLTSNSSLMLRPENWLAWIRQPGGTVLNTGDPTFFPRYLHILFASAAIGGLAHAFIATWNRNAYADPGMAETKINRGLRWFRHATFAQILAGLWFFLALPPEVRGAFMGGSALATAALILSLAGALLIIIMSYRKKIYALCAVTAGLVLVMVAVRDIVRDVMLRPYFGLAKTGIENGHDPGAIPLALEKGQHIGFAFFIICAVFAVSILVWLTRSVTRAVREGKAQAVGAGSAVEE